jgi:hypothetical protein
MLIDDWLSVAIAKTTVSLKREVKEKFKRK